MDRIAFVPTVANGTTGFSCWPAPSPRNNPCLSHSAPRMPIRSAEASHAVTRCSRRAFAGTLRVGVGDFVAAGDAARPGRRPRVGGIAVEFAAGGAALYLDWTTATALFGPPGVHVFLVTADPARKGEAEAAVARFCGNRGLSLQQRNRELRVAVDDLTRGLTVGLWALLAVMVVFAALGVANAVAALAIRAAPRRGLFTLGSPAARRRVFRAPSRSLSRARGCPGRYPVRNCARAGSGSCESWSGGGCSVPFRRAVGVSAVDGRDVAWGRGSSCARTPGPGKCKGR